MTNGDDDAVARERERLAALYRYDVLDTPPEEAFDRITRLTKRVLQMAIVTVTFIDSHRQWFKSRQGIALTEALRDTAFCSEVIKHDEILIVEDALSDPRFATHPAVVGEPHLRFYCGVPLKTRDGHAIGTLCAIDLKPRHLEPDEMSLFADLGHLVMDELELRLVASVDSLTGTLSRRTLRREAARDFLHARRQKQELSCIVFDVDHFKRINDTYGHVIGDYVLQELVSICQRNLRATDYIGRIGGEEFMIMLPQTNDKAAFEVAERLRGAIEQAEFKTRSGPLKVTVSFGVANSDKSVADIDALLRRADVALYGAKRAGRNRAVNFATQNLDPGLRVA
ncbi:MAG: sensor domain-containing diguanylate cyclase [Hyphomicrobiales bacterium]|nr:sensor domain-containing diguanylate cyclase [Hyphomicrobiales bacterium]MBV8767350.1 sensor domain-containing diguanylate cyclase [Hyphomicrobiales bacterium]MBV9051503.1 sensor domain-containing diguanylate cyclase [Hyphomicrobiales bacterium]MBV9138764.1 sensor domain-containing diguanylate cyclase [Hyphomicrobiales bacterium]MBV9975250.1 sensor domain-containing diguanylate cyclase [Hyphomicrobiales bacterium]